MVDRPELRIVSVRIAATEPEVSRRCHAEVLGFREQREWSDGDGVVRGVAS